MYVSSYCDTKGRTVQNRTALKTSGNGVFQLGFRQEMKDRRSKADCSEELQLVMKTLIQYRH